MKLEIKIKFINFYYEEFNLSHNELICRFNTPGNFENVYFTIDLKTFRLHAFYRDGNFIFFLPRNLNEINLNYYIWN